MKMDKTSWSESIQRGATNLEKKLYCSPFHKKEALYEKKLINPQSVFREKLT